MVFEVFPLSRMVFDQILENYDQEAYPTFSLTGKGHLILF